MRFQKKKYTIKLNSCKRGKEQHDQNQDNKDLFTFPGDFKVKPGISSNSSTRKLANNYQQLVQINQEIGYSDNSVKGEVDSDHVLEESTNVSQQGE